MKRSFIITVFTLVSIVSFGQSNQILTEASKWFKESYVNKNFKDPYSYKELKITLDSMTHGEYFDRIKDSFNIKNNSREVTYYQKKYNDELSQKRPSKIIVDMYKERLDEYTKKLNNSIDEYNIAKINNDNKSNEVRHYIIKIDCHANNSYGGQVLGRYVFSYTKHNGFEGVFKTN